MHVRFYFDPACPWCWVTSRWVARVAPARDLTIDWRPISLMVRNEGKDIPEQFRRPAERSFELLRVVEAMRAAGEEAGVGAFYAEVGRRIHHDHDGEFTAADALTAAGLDPAFADAAKDPVWDDAVRASTAEAVGVAGEDVGTPIIALEVEPGRWEGFFGPVLTRAPEGEEALRLWDGYVAVVSVPGLWELKRTRTEDPVLPRLD